MKALVVGDVHGCIAELRELVKLAGDRRLISVGDLVGKGPSSEEVVRFVRKRKGQMVVGNHDERLIRWRQAAREGTKPPPLRATHLEAALKLRAKDWAFLESCPYFLRIPEHNAIVVHAGLVPGVDLERQKTEHLITMRTIRPDGRPSESLDAGEPWATLWHGPEEVIFGHDAITGLQIHEHAVGIDTGCVYGGALTGYLLPEREIVSVPAKRAYAPPGK